MKNIKTKRSRKDCIRFQDHNIPVFPLRIVKSTKHDKLKIYNKGRCMYDPKFTGNFPDCSGVNCGCFKIK